MMLIAQALWPAVGVSETNSWTKPASGYWEEAYWSLGVLPDITQMVEITNAGWKAVAIGTSTVQTASESLAVRTVDLYGDNDSATTLLLNYAGTNVPLHVLENLTLRGNAVLVNLYSGLQVDGNLEMQGGEGLYRSGEVNQDFGFTSVAGRVNVNGHESYNLTNGLLHAGSIAVGITDSAAFRQYGGKADAETLAVGAGYSGPLLTETLYALYDGELTTANLDVGGGDSFATFVQWGGTNKTGRLRVLRLFDRANYALNGGWLLTTNTEIFSNGDGVFNQNGGSHIVQNDLRLEGTVHPGPVVCPAQYNLSGGELSALTVTVGPYAIFAQSNTTASIADALQLYPGNALVRTTSFLAGGVLSTANVRWNGIGENLVQTGGSTLLVSNLFSFGGTGPYKESPARYLLESGTLVASNIELTATMILSTGAGTVSNAGYFKLGGSLVAQGTTQRLGSLILLANSLIDLEDGTRLRFAASGAETWAPAALLYVTNWNGNALGGGPDQLVIGTDPTGLTLAQLNQIRFVDAAGFPGTNYARILSTGEIVPGPTPLGMTNMWTKGASGSWEEPYWCLGMLPDMTQTVQIMSRFAVTIGSSTVRDFPASLTVNQLEMPALPFTQGTLLLNHAGMEVPLRVRDQLTVGSSGKVVNLYSGLTVGLGGLFLNGGEIDQDGGFVSVQDLLQMAGGYYLTNGLLQAPRLQLSGSGGARFGQYGGMVQSGSVFLAGNGQPAVYTLQDGALLSTNVTVGGGHDRCLFAQSGGTNTTGQLQLEGFYGRADYILSGGLLLADNEHVYGSDYNGAKIEQTGGKHSVTNGVVLAGGLHHGATLYPGEYVLSAGEFAARFLEIGLYASYSQSNGLAVFAESLRFNAPSAFTRPTSFLTGGTLATREISSTGASVNWLQTGGALIVTNLMAFGGTAQPLPGFATYTLSGGSLNAGDIVMTGRMVISLRGQAHRISNPGTFSLGGSMATADIDEALGRFILLTNSTIDLGGTSNRLAFADSRQENWGAGTLLCVSHWNGSTGGGGADQLAFGNSANALTPRQLSQIRFVDAAGFSGTNYATILNTGEVVPRLEPVLVAFRQDATFILEWPGEFTLLSAPNVHGPYTPVPGASSPCAVNITTNQSAFFRLLAPSP